MRVWRRIGFVLLLAGAMAALAACAGDGGSTDTTGGGDTPTTEESSPDTTEAPGDGSGGEGVPGLSTVCVNATQAMAAAVASYSTGIAGAMGGTLDEDELQEVTEQLEAMAAAAPDEIRADLEVIAHELDAFYTAWAEIGYTGSGTPTPEQIAQLEALGEVVDQDAFDEASANIDAWFQANCG
ncbi:MAG TPA: hypothetical protein VG872_02055 [Acidimicrobiia bacterium]|nr:hypothetical protein [Acidimicrobiia bacterium]